MIISERHGFIFVHVPKCAGTSLRTQIADSDPDHIALAEVGEHPVLGTIDFGHVTMKNLHLHFPDLNNHFGTLPSFAVIRDPLSRFGSALRQYLWRYENVQMTMIAPDDLRRHAIKAMERIEREIDDPSHQMIFFARQTDFVYLNEVRIVDHLLPIENVANFIAYLAKKTGSSMDTERRSNQNIDLRMKWVGPIAFRANAFLRNALPQGVHARIKDTALTVLASKKSAAETSGILDLPEVHDFVTNIYAGDNALYARAQAEAPTLLTGFANDMLPRVATDVV